MASATLRLERQGVGIELRRGVNGAFTVLVDGADAALIKERETIEIPLEPGHHTIRIRGGRYSSHEQGFDVAEGEAITFRCHGVMIWPMYLASLAKADLGITLKHERYA